MKQFIHDWIHLTQGEMFIKYWHLWLFILLSALLISIVVVWWHDDVFNQHSKTLQERVDAQETKDLRDKLKQWERHIEPLLIKRGDSVEYIVESKKLYFSDDDVRKQLDYLYLRNLYPNRHFRGPTKPTKK
ncbi:hypothetical protein D0502_02130 [Leuconostoc falkenbergense]|uniref:Uncharacterized protein n=1 Tax=Leuconostoc falkenbergense TaxID=2766470 RepID=A0A9X3IND5_9LACO|nr:hypothetical protein [Leuconostoc falkenbergense]MCX7578199.1 hypothetical protein [Leuconostoc falkenbergense]